MFDKLKVECRSGYKANETPIRFSLDDDTTREVVEVCDRWYDPEADYFKVRGDDGYLYLLRRDRCTDEWGLRFVKVREPQAPVPGGGNSAESRPRPHHPGSPKIH